MLAAEGRFFLTATSGNEALKLVLKNENIGLILLDVQMPGMDGFEVARILKSNPRTREIAIIFVTAISKTEQNILQGFGEGAVDYLQKPLDINVTLAKVRVFEKLYFYQQELKFAYSDLQIINKQLERFVYMVSHDLKSPLASIITMLSILRKHPQVVNDNYLQENMDMVYIASTHLSEMIGSILEYSRQSLSQQEIEEVDTGLLVSEISFMLMPPPNIKIVVSDKLPVLFTRKLKLQQVFQNLLSNAIKYMDKPEGLIEVKAENKDKFYLFSVKDNGPGIAKQDKEKIFNLFYVTDNRSQKDSETGVGLNILKMLVEEQGGSIWVDSQPGVGSTFYFEWSK
jgi:signal transduction histidine kinase